MKDLVPNKNVFDVSAEWGARTESAEALARRWISLIERLQTIDPALSTWTHWEDGPGLVPFDPRLETQLARVIGGTTRTRDGRLFPHLGTRIRNSTYPCPRSRCFKINMRAGADRGCNQIIGETDYFAIPDPDLFTFRLFYNVVLAAAETFEATQARVYPAGLRNFWSDTRGIGEKLDLAWISYIGPRFAHLVTPPSSVIVEHRPDGGLLMASTAETFSTDDARHLDAAREIKAALGAFNAVPWTPETGK